MEPKSTNSKEWFDKLEKVRKAVRDRMHAVHERERERYLKTHLVKQYVPGERVWVKVLPKDREKLDPTWMGPCEVLKHVHGGRYTVKTPFGDEDHHMDSFKPYVESHTGKSIPFLYYKPPKVPESDTWTVEKILKHREYKGKQQWLVLWKGYTNPTWEGVEQFIGYAQDDWRDYNKKHKIPVVFE